MRPNCNLYYILISNWIFYKQNIISNCLLLLSVQIISNKDNNYIIAESFIKTFSHINDGMNL